MKNFTISKQKYQEIRQNKEAKATATKKYYKQQTKDLLDIYYLSINNLDSKEENDE